MKDPNQEGYKITLTAIEWYIVTRLLHIVTMTTVAMAVHVHTLS